jgi:hypothetical protein
MAGAMELPDTFWSAARLVGGFAMFCLGVSFTWKFFQAAFLGKMAYWSGLEKFGFLFIPITWFISPLLIHLPYDTKKTLIAEHQQVWVHLVFGPVFFVAALMFMTSGADLMNLPGSTSLNTILTLGRSDVPPCIVYSPPFNYRFPFVKKATKTVIKALTIKIPEDRTKSYNAFEQRGDVDTSQYSKVGGDIFYEDDEDKPAVATPQQVEQYNRIKATQGKKHK